jgi:hypothetical protein
MSPENCKAGALPTSYIPVLTCGFASHHASWTVAQHSNSTITAAQDWMAYRGCIRARALRLSALLSSDDFGHIQTRTRRPAGPNGPLTAIQQPA